MVVKGGMVGNKSVQTPGFGVGALTDLWDKLRKQMQHWEKKSEMLGRISMILTLIKYNGMISEKVFVPGNNFSTQNV